MSKLARYLMRNFLREAAALFFVALFLVWIIQTLRLFDLITAKGQGLLTLAGQALLTTPALGATVYSICVGIGIGRTMRAMQISSELHTIHVTQRTGALWSAFAGFTIGAAILTTLAVNWVEPAARFAYGEWSVQVAADLVGRTLEPHRFNQITPDFVVQIGGRNADGTITDFFADDRRVDGSWRTYSARSATITLDASGYFVELHDGILAFQTSNGEYSEIRFATYKLALDRISSSEAEHGGIYEMDTLHLLQNSSYPLSPEILDLLQQRAAETMRVLSMGLLIAALTAFPSARRRQNRLPIEIVVLGTAILDRALSETTRLPYVERSTASLFIMSVGICIFLVRLYGFRLARKKVIAP